VTPPGSRRLKWFRLLAVILSLVLFFGILELGLRLFGYGYSTGFFRQTEIGGRAVYVENDQFGLRFFPRALARIPSPTVVPVVKGSNTCRIFILGESAALGDPEPAFGFGRYLETLLRARFPDRKFEVVSAAMTAINSHALLPIARDCSRLDGDLWVIYMGNNEVVGPFGAGTILGPQSPPLFAIRASLALKQTRTGQLLDSLIETLTPAAAAPESWQGMKMFVNAKTRPTDQNRKRTESQFRANLTDILQTARQAGVPVILCTVASNLKDCAPFASLHAQGLSDPQRRDWDLAYHAAFESESAGKWGEAIRVYQQAAALDGQFAELQFRLGRCHLALSQTNEARRCFELARDFDALPFRTTTPLNTIIRETGRRFAGPGIALLDAEAALDQLSSQGITGDEIFYEHVHFNLDGNYQLARLVAAQVTALLPQLTDGNTPREWASADACNERLSVTPWDRYRVDENVRQRLTQPPFTLQSDHRQQLQFLAGNLSTLRAQMNSNAVPTARASYRRALQAQPDDFLLHGNFAKLLEDTGDPADAVVEWERVRDLLPYHFGPTFYLGKLFARLGRLDDASRELTRTLQLRPGTVEVMEEFGRVRLQQKRPAEAMLEFQQGLALQPGNARLHLGVAEALAQQGQRAAATKSLRQAIALRPDYWEARYLLGVELAANGDIAGARDQFGEVVRLKPDHVAAHLNLGVALAKENQLPAAIRQFRATLQLDPSNRAAADYLSKLGAN